MGRRGYPPEFRRKVLDLVKAGRPIAEVAQALGISDQSIYTWRRQDRVDRGLEPGLSSAGGRRPPGSRRGRGALADYDAAFGLDDQEVVA
jgi:transposase-like protein